MGDKIRSKNHVAGYGVPVVPGIAEPGMTDEELIAAAPAVGFPLLIKPSAGGGGKGMHGVDRPGDLASALATARRVAASAFGDDTLFLERLVTSPRHIEVQVLADTHGNVIHLGERECSLQRRHQKVIEEAPSPLLESLADGERRPREDRRGRVPGRPQRPLHRRRHGGVPRFGRLPGRVLLHGNEHPAPGGASGDGNGHRHRPCRVAGPHRRR
jgi:biotin carboxylase